MFKVWALIVGFIINVLLALAGLAIVAYVLWSAAGWLNRH